MALTNLSQVTSSGIHTLSNYTTHNINSTGIITATSFSGNLSSASGISTFAEIRVTGNLTVEGTTTTLDSTLTEVDRLEIGANTAAVGLALTQSGSGHAATFEGGNIGIGTDNPDEKLEVYGGNIQQYNENASGGTGLILHNYAAGGGGNTSPYSFIRAKSNPIRNAGEIRFGRDSAYGSAAEADSHISFWTAKDDTNTERLRITSDGKVNVNQSSGAVGSKFNIFNGSDNANIFGITGADESSEYAAIGVNGGNAVFTGGGFDTTSTGIVFRTANGGAETEKVRITSDGNVGIGSQSPGVKLDVQMPGSSSRQNLARFRHEGQTDLVIQGQWGSQDIGSANGTLLYNSSQTLALRSGSSGNAHVVLRSTGNIGIGTDNPLNTLHVKGPTGGVSARFTDAVNATVFVSHPSSGKSKIADAGGNYGFEFDTASVNILSGGSERLRIFSGGQVAIATATNYANANADDLIVGNRNNNESGITIGSANQGQIAFADSSADRAGLIHYQHTDDSMRFYTNGPTNERLRIKSDGQIDAKYGVINLGTADSSSGHINAYELMTFNIDSDNDDTNRHFTWYKNAASGAGTGMMRLTEDARLVIGGDLADSGNNVTLKHATNVEVDMHCTGGSGNNFRIKSNSDGSFIVRDHSAGDDRITITDYGKVGINSTTPTARLDIDHPHTEQGLIVRSRYGNIATAMVKFDGDPGGNGGDGNVLHLHGGNSRTDSEILHIDSTGVGDIFDIRGDGLTRVYKQLQLEHSSNVAKIIFNEYGANDPKAQIEMDQVSGSAGQLIFRTQDGGTLTERLRITSDGKLMTQSAGYIYTASSAGSLSLHGGNTNLGGKIVLSGGNTNGDIRFYAQMSTSSPAQRVVIGATGQVEVSNTVNGNDAAVNIYKASGDNSDKAILRVGYNAAAAFEIYRVRTNGDIFMGPNQSGADLIFQNVPTGGSTTERLRIQENGDIGVGGITSPSFTTGGGIHLKRNYGIGFGDGNNGRPDFQLVTDGTTLDFRCGNGADTADIQMTTDGKLRLGNTIASLAGDDCVKDMIAGRAMVNRFRRGTSNGTRFGTVTGYIGDMLSSDGPPLSNVFYMGQLNSSSSSNATQNMFSYYTSGHWGQYTSMRVWMHVDYYNHGYQVWDVYNGSITSVASRGSGGNLTTSSAILVGSGTHSGQNVYRYDVTVENPGTYFQVRWYLGLYFGAAVGVFSNAYTASSMDTYLSTRGSGIHFKGLSAAALSSSPMYRTQ